MEQQLGQVLTRTKASSAGIESRSSFLWFTATQLKRILGKVKKSPTKQHTARWILQAVLPSFKSEQFRVIFSSEQRAWIGWRNDIVNYFFSQQTENKFKQQKKQITELQKRLFGLITPSIPTNEDLPTISREMLQQLEIMLTKARQSSTKQYAQGWIITVKVSDSEGEQPTISLDQVVDFKNQKKFHTTLSNNQAALRYKLERQENEIETELTRLTNIAKTRLKAELNKNSQFLTLTEHWQNQLVNKFFNDGLLKNQVNAAFIQLANTEKEKLWTALKHRKNLLTNLVQTHQIKRKNVHRLKPLVIYFNKPENMQKPFSATPTPIKAMIDEWFKQGITVKWMQDFLIQFVQEQLPLYWKDLKTELGNYETLIDKIEQFVIDQNNYLTILKKLKTNKDTVFANLNPTQKDDLQRLFDQGVTIEQLSKQFQQKEAEDQRKQKEAEKQNKAKEEAEVKKRKQTKLTIGLGVGLGVPILVSGGGLTYWLLRKYRN